MATLLIVEDKDEHRNVICDMLHAEGYLTIEASDGKEALKKLQQKGRIDLITLDEQMPVMTGLECLEEIKSNPDTQDIPVIFITVYRTAKIEDLRKEGIPVILKPYDYREFIKLVKSTLKKSPKRSFLAWLPF